MLQKYSLVLIFIFLYLNEIILKYCFLKITVNFARGRTILTVFESSIDVTADHDIAHIYVSIPLVSWPLRSFFITR